jgi:hypothetical protein
MVTMNSDEPLQLRDFVAETIKQVIDGVATAQEYATGKRAVVNPKVAGGYRIEPISFDVAVTAAKGTKTQGGVAVFIGAFGLGSKSQSEKSNEMVNRIQFKVHIRLPIGAPFKIAE